MKKENEQTEQRSFEDRLFEIVKELAEVNAYEFPYRVPELQARADKLLLARKSAK